MTTLPNTQAQAWKSSNHQRLEEARKIFSPRNASDSADTLILYNDTDFRLLASRIVREKKKKTLLF